MHLSPLDQAMIEVESPFVCFYALHFIWNQYARLGSLGHHALKCAIGGPSFKERPPLRHKQDKGCVGTHICLKCIAMPCFALCCFQNSFCRKLWPAGHLYYRPTNYWWPRAQQMVDDHPDMVGGGSTWSGVIHSVHRAYLGRRAIFRRTEQGKQMQTCAWQWTSERSRARIAPGPLPEAVYCFIRLVNLLN